MPAYARDIYEQEEVAKLLATCSHDGDPNVALIVSQIPVDERTLVFGEFMMVKTKKNLDTNPRVATLAVTQKLDMAGFKGDVVEWVRSGPYIDRINSIDFFRYNAYAGIHNVAVLSLKEMLQLPPRVSYASFAADYLMLGAVGRWGRTKAEGVVVPGEVSRKFDNLVSVKVLAFLDQDGYPCIVPTFATRFVKQGILRFKVSSYNTAVTNLELPRRVALNVVTLDPLTYQVKGDLVRFLRKGGVEFGEVVVQEVYTSNPPLCGERIA